MPALVVKKVRNKNQYNLVDESDGRIIKSFNNLQEAREERRRLEKIFMAQYKK